MSFPSAHKTVFVLDHGPSFASGSGDFVECELGNKGKSSSNVDNRLEKSLWTCSVEAALEYRRIVNDIYLGTDKQRLIRFVISDFVGRFLTAGSWLKVNATDSVLESLAQLGAPDKEGDPDACCIINGISLAVEALTEVTEQQKQLRRRGSQIKNNGRIIVITQLKDDEEVSMIENHILEQILERNNLVKNLDENYLQLDQVELCLINTFPLKRKSKITNRASTKVSNSLWSECRSVQASSPLISCIHSLILRHYDLVSTTVSGIPMKEEANAGISVNYDVELFHGRVAHDNLLRAAVLDDCCKTLEGKNHTTLTLQWCTPNAKNGSAADYLSLCCTAFRVTPASVNSRPSACLTSFLLSGRSVMLELPGKKSIAANFGGKVITHVLMCHGGAISIHGLLLGKSPLEEPPSISEGPGGRVTDYRISNFGELMRECSLQPDSTTTNASNNNEKAKRHLTQLTKFWPMTFSDTIIFSIAQRFEPILSLVKKSELSENDIHLCRQAILQLVSMEQTNEPLFSPGSLCTKLKGIKNRDEQYRMAFEECENYLRNYAHISSNHLSVLNCLLTCTGRQRESSNVITHTDQTCVVKSEEVALNTFLDEVDKKASKAEPPAKKLKSNDPLFKPGEKITLFELFLRRYEAERLANWRDFDGRKDAKSNKVELYTELFKPKEEQKPVKQSDDMEIST